MQSVRYIVPHFFPLVAAPLSKHAPRVWNIGLDPATGGGDRAEMNTLLFIAFLMNPQDRVELRVTFYDNSGLGWDSRIRTFAEAERILRGAGVDIVWVEGDPASPEVRLIQYPERPRQGSETDAACRARADIALELLVHAPTGLKGSVLGVAQPFATAGLNVRLFTDRIEAAALRARQPVSVVAGHVLAHEISHVMLRSHEHSTSGLMAGVWGDHEYSRMPSGTLLLSRAQAESVRSSWKRTGCPSAKNEPVQTGSALAPRQRRAAP